MNDNNRYNNTEQDSKTSTNNKTRLNYIDQILTDNHLDVLILTDIYNIRYLSGYRGDTGCLLFTNTNKYILTDSRYIEQAGAEAKGFEVVDITSVGYAKGLNSIINEISKDEQEKIRIGFENEHISYRQYKAFKQALDDKAIFVPVDNKISKIRAVKDDDELDSLVISESIGDKAFGHIIEFIEIGMTEKEIALELEYTMKKLGAEALSFDTIVASGPNSSMPHAIPSDRKIADGDFITMDFGCIYNGYCSDMTRTVFVGDDITKEQWEVYSIVLMAQKEALKAIRAGVKCSDVDKVARDIISSAGYGEYFSHGLGHSTGLYIHETPSLSKNSEDILEAGNVVTVEPGIYLPGKFGVRIEDMVVVTKDGYNNLTTSPKVLVML